jgi:hypothetical protein
MRNLIIAWLSALAIAAIAFAPRPATAVTLQQNETAPPAFAGKPTGNMAKADSALRRLYGEHQAHLARGRPDRFVPSNTGLQYSKGRVVIDAVAAEDSGLLLEDLKGLGLTSAAQYKSVVSGLIPIGAIQRLVALDSVLAVSASWRPITNHGLVESEGVLAMGADLVHAGLAALPEPNTYTGSGVMVGVLSDSYDQQGDAATDQLNDDLPPGVTVLDDTANCGNILIPSPCTDEGRAMMQIIHDMAPDASMAFHTAFLGEANFAQAIEELAAAGADIIVDDVFYFAEPMFQDGIIAQAVDTVVGQGVAYFAAAGNAGRFSYESAYQGSGEILYVEAYFMGIPMGLEFRGELHDFDPGAGVDWSQEIIIPAGRTVTFILQWDQPFSSVSPRNGSQSDVDIYLTIPEGIIASGVTDNLTSGIASEVLQYNNAGDTDLVAEVLITHFDGPQADPVKYIVYGGGANLAIQYATNSPTSFGHANSAGAEAVGAAFYQDTPEYGTAPANKEWFSSVGGIPIKFDGAGQRLAMDIRRWTPGITAVDGVNTTFFYSDTTLDADEWPNFFGTSAAAPHAAAVAALMREADPTASPAEIYGALQNSALDMGSAIGFDYDTGHGLVWAPAAVVEIIAMLGDPPDPGPAPEPIPGSNIIPAVVITSPADGVTIATDESIAFVATATDYEDGDLTAGLVWNSSLDGEIGTGAGFSTSTLSAGSHTVTASVTDSALALGSSMVNVNVVAPNAVPVVVITSPADGATYASGDLIAFTGTADDAEDGDIKAGLAWTSSLDGPIGDGSGFSTTGLSVGSHTVTASVSDSALALGSSTVNVTVEAANAVPVVTISSPTDGMTFVTGETITFTGAASDTEDGDLTAGLAWTSSLDGEIGTGASFPISTLSAGSHTVTASVSDSALALGSSTVDVNVVAPNDIPVVTITSPADGLTYISGDLIAFTGTADDTEDGDLKTGLTWTSNLDGTIGSGSGFSTTTLSVGTHTVTASVSDSALALGSSTVDITVEAANIAPVADAGPDQGGEVLSDTLVIDLDGNGSYDPDGGPLTSYEWTLISKPRKSGLTSVDIGGANTAYATFEPDKAGRYEFQLTVSDGLDSSSDTMVLTVEKPPKTSGGGGCNPKKPGCTG